METASVLHLYTEGFRTVEDIYNILQISHSRRKTHPTAPPPKAKLMAAYYEKLTTLFWVSENYLFHAFAWYKYYTLCKEYNRSMSEEMKQRQASAVLLAALCIPSNNNNNGSLSGSNNNRKQQSHQPQHGITSTAEDDIVKEKMARMATLLGFHTRHPTREALLTELRSKQILDSVPKYLKELYLLLEENSDPLVMVDQAKPLLQQLQQELGDTTNETDPDDAANTDVTNALGRYVQPLTSVLLLKLLLNLSAAYHTVSMDHLKRLTSGLGIAFDQVEKSIVAFTQTKALVSVRIDHRAGCLRFGDPKLESDAMRSQLTTFSKQLEAVCLNVLQPPDQAHALSLRTQLYAQVRANLEREHLAVLERKNTIEKRKEEAERLAQEKLKAERQQKSEEEAARKVEEEKRLAKEQRLREREKQRKIQKEMEAMEKKKYLQAMGRNTEAMTEEEMASIDTAALAKEHADKTNKKREEAERKAREAAKRLDYLVRAVRIEELPLIKTAYEDKIRKDRDRYEATVIEKAKRAKEQWEADVKEKAQLEKHAVFNYLQEFKDKVFEGRKIHHKRLCKAADETAELEAEKAKLARARKRKQDEAKRLADEEAQRKAEEAKRLAEEEKARREEEKRRLDEKRRQAELTRMKEERDRKEKERRPPPTSRELDAAQTGKYVPPSRRGRDGGGGGGRYDRGGGSSYDRGGGYGGGRYEGRQQGGDRWGNRGGGGGDRRYDDRRGGYNDDRRGGGGYNDDRRGGGYNDDRLRGGYNDRRRDDRGGGGGGGNRRW